jgi:hypothetical protein
MSRVRLVGKERLMTSELVTFLMEEQVSQREARYVEDLQDTLEATIAARFPAAPLSLALIIRRIMQPEELHRLIVAVVRAPNLETVEQELNRAAPPTAGEPWPKQAPTSPTQMGVTRAESR